VFLYVVTPLLIPGLWLFNRRTDPRNLADTNRSIPPIVRWITGAVGVLLTLILLILFVVPEPMIDAWPWGVSPLTSRVLLGWAAVFSVASMFVAFETRWTAAKIPIESLVIWFVLLLVGFARSWSDVDPANPILWGVLGGIVAYLIGLSVLYLVMERR
jgi:hypothetical protein